MKDSQFVHRLLPKRTSFAVIALVAGGLGASGHDGAAARAQTTCTLQCASGEIAGCADEPLSHKAIVSAQDKDGAGEPHSDCHAGSCSQWHPCPPSGGGQPDVVAQVEAAVGLRDMTTLARALVRDSSTVRLNVDREAFQVLDCRANVVAHFPAPSDLVARLRPAALAALR
jgi:hypothetical protein